MAPSRLESAAVIEAQRDRHLHARTHACTHAGGYTHKECFRCYFEAMHWSTAGSSPAGNFRLSDHFDRRGLRAARQTARDGAQRSGGSFARNGYLQVPRRRRPEPRGTAVVGQRRAAVKRDLRGTNKRTTHTRARLESHAARMDALMRHVAALNRGSPMGTASGLRFARCMFPTGVRCLLHKTGVLRLLHDVTKACHHGMLCCVTVSVACCVLAFVLRSRSDNVTACAGGKFCIHADDRLGTLLGSPCARKGSSI